MKKLRWRISKKKETQKQEEVAKEAKKTSAQKEEKGTLETILEPCGKTSWSNWQLVLSHYH